MTKIYNKAGDLIRQSRNLRGMLDHGRREVPTMASFAHDSTGVASRPYVLVVFFANGDKAISPFEDPRVAARFLSSRRSWGRIKVQGIPSFVAEYATGRRL